MKVWVTRKGRKTDTYHTDKDCRYLESAQNKRPIQLEAISHYTECSECADEMPEPTGGRKDSLRREIIRGNIDPEDHAPEF